MLSAISLLVLLASAIAINADPPPPPSRCNDANIGQPTSHAVKLQPVTLQPGIRDWRIDIPNIPECVYGESGVQAFACDQDVAPIAYFVNFNQLIVKRQGSLQGYGTVTITVYCNA